MKKSVADTSIMKTTMHVFPDKRQSLNGPDGRMFKEILADGTEIRTRAGAKRRASAVHNTDGRSFYRGDRGNEFLTYQVLTTGALPRLHV